jgi:hypothetical protein
MFPSALHSAQLSHSRCAGWESCSISALPQLTAITIVFPHSLTTFPHRGPIPSSVKHFRPSRVSQHSPTLWATTLHKYCAAWHQRHLYRRGTLAHDERPFPPHPPSHTYTTGKRPCGEEKVDMSLYAPEKGVFFNSNATTRARTLNAHATPRFASLCYHGPKKGPEPVFLVTFMVQVVVSLIVRPLVRREEPRERERKIPISIAKETKEIIPKVQVQN